MTKTSKVMGLLGATIPSKLIRVSYGELSFFLKKVSLSVI